MFVSLSSAYVSGPLYKFRNIGFSRGLYKLIENCLTHSFQRVSLNGQISFGRIQLVINIRVISLSGIYQSRAVTLQKIVLLASMKAL